MKDISRRQLLAGGLLGRTVTLAGCLGRRATGGPSRAPTGTDGPATRARTAEPAGRTDTAGPAPSGDGESTRSPAPPSPDDVSVGADATTVRFPAIADGAVTVDDRRVRYTEPFDATFEVGAVWGDEKVPGDGPPLVASRTLRRDGPPTAFVAPVYRDAAGFEYRLYANDAFRDAFDWYVLAVPGSSFETADHLTRPAALEPHAAGVYRDVVRPEAVPDAGADEPLSVVLSNYTVGEIVDESPADVAVVGIEFEGGVARPTAPQVRFSLSRTDGGVELRHVAGSTLAADAVVVTVDDERSATQFEGTVSAGTSVVLDAGSGATVEVTYVGGETRTPLAALIAP